MTPTPRSTLPSLLSASLSASRSASLSASRSTLASLIALALASGCSDSAVGDGSEGGSGDTTEAGTQGTSGIMSTSGVDGESTAVLDDPSASDMSESDTDADTEGDTDTGEPGGVACIDEQYVSGVSPGPDYSEYDVELGSHCQGTNQQDITEIERVVFIGDSVTVGTPPTGATAFYRSIVASELATMFGLDAPEFLWQQYDPIGGTSVLQESGDFASCAVWGARNDDLISQLEDCFAVEDYPMRTLVVFTMGGNDGAALAKDYLDGMPLATVLEELDSMVAHHEMAIDWLVGDAGKFPNGVFVVNANVYEFTDATLDFLSCPAAGTAGFNSNPDNPDVLLGALRLINEEYMRIAEENGTDVVFMSEGFCGHGYHSNDPSSPCYRGEGNATWFDFTCIHPTPSGHEALAEMFMSVISE